MSSERDRDAHEGTEPRRPWWSQQASPRVLKLIGYILLAPVYGGLYLILRGPFVHSNRNPLFEAAKADLSAFSSALQSFRLDNDRYPTTQEGLAVLTSRPPGFRGPWNGPYLTKPIGNDPWGNPYVYLSPGLDGGKDSYTVESYGPTGRAGDPGNIVENGG